MPSKNQGNSGTNKRGFASMDPERQREIASLGGRVSHGGGNAAGSSSGKASASSGGSESSAGGSSRGTQGGSSDQHAAAGRQSHKNDK